MIFAVTFASGPSVTLNHSNICTIHEICQHQGQPFTNGLVFPDLNSPPFGGETFRTNLIMPEPCPFPSRKLPIVSVIRPTETRGIAMGVVNFLTAMGLFIGQSPQFFELLKDLAADADAARRGVR